MKVMVVVMMMTTRRKRRRTDEKSAEHLDRCSVRLIGQANVSIHSNKELSKKTSN